MDNLKLACEEAGIKFTQKELEEMIEEADINGDGRVDQSEFIRIMLQTNLFWSNFCVNGVKKKMCKDAVVHVLYLVLDCIKLAFAIYERLKLLIVQN